MDGFAIDAAQENIFRADPAPVQFPDKPLPFWGAFDAALKDQRETRNTGVRSGALRDLLWDRHRAIEKATGQKIAPSDFMIDAVREPGVAPQTMPADTVAGRVGQVFGVVPAGPAYPTDAEYEARLDKLRTEHTAAFAGIESRQALQARLDARLKGVRAEAERAFGPEGNSPGAFVGATLGALTDPVNAITTIATGGAGAGRPLAARLLAQAGANAGVEALQVPGRMAEAKVAGPAYTPGEAAADIGFAGVAGAGFELAGHGIGVAARRLIGAASPATRGAAVVVDEASRDDAVLGRVDGALHEEGLDALARGQPRPPVEPAQELGDLFGPGPAAPTGVEIGPARVTGESDYRGRRIYGASFDPKGLDVDPARFQYKADGDAAGVTARLRGVEAWDATASGKVIVFEERGGRQVVADGHQRLGLAKRLDDQGFDPRLDGYLFREADGWSARQVRTIAALKNIREGSGTILDAAKVFRDAPEALTDRSLPLTGEFMSQARALARLTPEAFGAVVNKVIPERYAAEIGAMAGERPDLHPGLVKLMKDGEPGNIEEARALIGEAMLDDWVKLEGEQTNLFGDLAPEATTIARAKVKSAVLASIRKDARIYGQLVKNADAIEAGGNVLLRDANEVAAVVNRTALEIISRLSLRSGEVGDALAGAAREVMAGKRPGDAARGLATMIRNRIASGEALEGVRLTALDPSPPSATAIDLLRHVDDPKAWEAQAKPAPEDAAIEGGLTTTTGEAQPIGPGDLWRLSPEDLQRQLAEAQASDHEKMLMALGSEDAVKEFNRLDRMRNSMDPARADQGAREFDAKFGALNADQERLIYGVGETTAQVDEIKALIDAHQSVMADDPDEWLAYMAAVAARRATVADLAKVASGDASVSAQVAFVQMQNAYDGLAARGVHANEIPGRMIDALIHHAGWRPEQAAEIIGGFVDDMTKLRQAPPAPALPPPGLFDDLPEIDVEQRAHQRLIQCAPGE